MQKIFKSSDLAMLIPFVLFGIWSVFSLRDYHKIDKNKIPAFIIQQGKLSKNQIADLTKLSDAKNIWVINDNKDFNRATELIKQSADAISYANQIGRLDLVSILLGIIAIIFGFAGIVGFMHIKEGVDVKTQVAVNENKNQLDQKIKEIEKDTNKHFEALSKKYFEDGGQASKIIARSVAQELDKNKTGIEDEDEEELN
jgi:hypothetical protein